MNRQLKRGRLLLTVLVLVLAVTRIDSVKLGGKTVENEVSTDIKKPSILVKMFPITSKLFTRHGDGLSFKQILQIIDDVVDQKELTIFAAVGWGLVPFTKSIYGLYAKITGRGFKQDDDDEEEEDEIIKKKGKILEAYEKFTPWNDDELKENIRSIGEKNGPLAPFEDTYLFHAVDHVSQASQIGVAVAMVDTMAHVVKLMGFTLQVRCLSQCQ